MADSSSLPVASRPPRRFGQIAASIGLLVLVTLGLFVAAGSWRWIRGWVFLGVLVVGLALHFAYVRRRNPELSQHRERIGPGTKRWDKIWNLFFWPLMIGTSIVAAVDARRADSAMPLWLWPVGLALFAAGLTVSAWAMGTNKFFEGTARIQTERGQYPVDTGPYRFIRHPGYLGLSLWALGIPFMLGSWRAVLLAVVTVLWLVIRTALEDRMLRTELPGYAEYAGRVRYRLVPWLW